MAINWRNVGFSGDDDTRNNSSTPQLPGSRTGIAGAFSALGGALNTIEDTRQSIGSSMLQRDLDKAETQEQLDAQQQGNRDLSGFFAPSEAQHQKQVEAKTASIHQQGLTEAQRRADTHQISADERAVSETNLANEYTDSKRNVFNDIRTNQGTGMSLENQNNKLYQSETYKNFTAEDKLLARSEISNDYNQRSELTGIRAGKAQKYSESDNLAIVQIEENYKGLKNQVINSSGVSADTWDLHEAGNDISVGDAVQSAIGQGVEETKFASDLEESANKVFKKVLGRKVKGSELLSLLKSTGVTESWRPLTENFNQFNTETFSVRATALADELKRIPEISSTVIDAMSQLKGEEKKAKDRMGERHAKRLSNLQTNERAVKRGEGVDEYIPDALAEDFVLKALKRGEDVIKGLSLATNPYDTTEQDRIDKEKAAAAEQARIDKAAALLAADPGAALNFDVPTSELTPGQRRARAMSKSYSGGR